MDDDLAAVELQLKKIRVTLGQIGKFIKNKTYK